jgi:hypothetical protein
MARKHVDPLKEKQKKQKMVAIALGVVFVGVLAFTGPKTWKQLHPSAPPAASSPSTTTAAPPAGTPTLAAPTLQGAEQSGSTTASSPELASATATIQDGQLASFSRFASKDPFAQQLSEDNESGGSTPSSGKSGSSPSKSPDDVPDFSGSEPAPGSAVISVNGTLYNVTVGDDFPQSSPTDPTAVPLFHLVSLTLHSAKISIVGGSYSDGAKTVTLRENKKVTLMNTADGTRYTLILKPQGTETGTDESGTTTTPTTVTLPAATP